MPDKPKTPLRAVRIPDDLWYDAKRIAEARGETVTAIVRTALERYVQKHGKEPE